VAFISNADFIAILLVFWTFIKFYQGSILPNFFAKQKDAAKNCHLLSPISEIQVFYLAKSVCRLPNAVSHLPFGKKGIK
jgi:hypothetical protein